MRSSSTVAAVPRKILRNLRALVQMPPEARRLKMRRRGKTVVDAVLIGMLGSGMNRRSRRFYVSYFPDAVAEQGAIPRLGEAVRIWTQGKASNNAGDLARMMFLLQNAERVVAEGVPGDFAELGVHKGHSAKLLADTIATADANRRIHLFDTFEGFDDRDLDGIDASVRKQFEDTSLESVRRFVGRDETCHYHPGYFPGSAEGIPASAKFAFVHLDCDLYQPMLAALKFFYPRLCSGATVVIHDYSSGNWPGVAQAVTEFLDGKRERLILMPDKSGTAIFRKY